MILAFGDAMTAKAATNNSWFAEALRIHGIEVVVVDLDEVARERIKSAQQRQIMTNPTGTV